MEFQFINPSIRIEKKPAVFDETKDAMIFMADALDVARSLPDESIDLIIADPPYFRVYGAFDFCMFETEQSYL
jgi:DNA modification methylase